MRLKDIHFSPCHTALKLLACFSELNGTRRESLSYTVYCIVVIVVIARGVSLSLCVHVLVCMLSKGGCVQLCFLPSPADVSHLCSSISTPATIFASKRSNNDLIQMMF